MQACYDAGYMRHLVPLLSLLLCLPAWGWGPVGHRLTARLADRQLTLKARARVAAILREGESLASIASWADDVRRSRSNTSHWHYIDIPVAQKQLLMERDCPEGDCVLAKAGDFAKALRDPALTPAKRREALMFIVHLVGDMHQPLHASDQGDRGGNEVGVRFRGKTANLHQVWDTGLLEQMGTEEELFVKLTAACQKQGRRWSHGSMDDWVEQAHQAARAMVYGKLPKTPGGVKITITPEYEREAFPVVELQLAKAGSRLARVLNEAFQ
jgi:hypothetical protein